MKIHPDQIEGVRQGQQQDRADKAKQPGQAFGDVLTSALEQGGAAKAAAPVPPLLGMDPTLGVSAVSAGQTDQQAVVARVEGMLDQVEQYAGNLEGRSLKQAYATLEGIRGQVADIREEWPSMEQDNPALSAMVNELDVLSATETFKFNRGDYS